MSESRAARVGRFAIGVIALGSLAFGGTGCGGSGGSQAGATLPGVVLINFVQSNQDNVPLNRALEFRFSSPIDPTTVNPDSIQIRVGPLFGQGVVGPLRGAGRPRVLRAADPRPVRPVGLGPQAELGLPRDARGQPGGLRDPQPGGRPAVGDDHADVPHALGHGSGAVRGPGARRSSRRWSRPRRWTARTRRRARPSPIP